MTSYQVMCFLSLLAGEDRGSRLEECESGACLYDLCIQLSIIMFGKELVYDTLTEIYIPKIKKWYNESK